jgi:hypothetical protein
VPITDELVAELAEKAEAGYDVDEILRRRGGRPPIGSAAASVESVRLDPELRDALLEPPRRDRETTSSVIRKALRKYLGVACRPEGCRAPRGRTGGCGTPPALRGRRRRPLRETRPPRGRRLPVEASSSMRSTGSSTHEM